MKLFGISQTERLDPAPLKARSQGLELPKVQCSPWNLETLELAPCPTVGGSRGQNLGILGRLHQETRRKKNLKKKKKKRKKAKEIIKSGKCTDSSDSHAKERKLLFYSLATQSPILLLSDKPLDQAVSPSTTDFVCVL